MTSSTNLHLDTFENWWELPVTHQNTSFRSTWALWHSFEPHELWSSISTAYPYDTITASARTKEKNWKLKSSTRDLNISYFYSITCFHLLLAACDWTMSTVEGINCKTFPWSDGLCELQKDWVYSYVLLHLRKLGLPGLRLKKPHAGLQGYWQSMAASVAVGRSKYQSPKASEAVCNPTHKFRAISIQSCYFYLDKAHSPLNRAGNQNTLLFIRGACGPFQNTAWDAWQWWKHPSINMPSFWLSSTGLRASSNFVL
jgi:hypothetical protein